MRAIDAVERADRLKPNAFDTKDKLAWLFRLDLQIYEELHAAYEGESSRPDAAGFNGANAMFEASYGAYRNRYNQGHRARSAVKRYW